MDEKSLTLFSRRPETLPLQSAGATVGEGKALVKGELQTVKVAEVELVDLDREGVVRQASVPATNGPRLVYALHVGGLLELDMPAYRAALDAADLVYADGVAVVLLARAAGAHDLERAPTTDVGLPILQEVARHLRRPARVALVGGPPGLAVRAGAVIHDSVDADVVLTVDGYFDDDDALLRQLHACRPDVVVVGMGMPREAVWTFMHKEDLPPAVILTCGGWFGFLTHAERRAPRALRAAGLEWTFRLAQDFPRLIGRYSRGALAVLRLLPHQFSSRHAPAR